MKKVSRYLLVTILLVITGCSFGKKNNELSNFIMNYCSILQLVYSRADLNLLSEYATENEIKRIFPIIQALKATNNVMKTEILDFKVKKTEVNKEKALIITRESWRYWWEDQTTGVISKPKAEETYNLEYHLLKGKNGQWKVDALRNLNE